MVSVENRRRDTLRVSGLGEARVSGRQNRDTRATVHMETEDFLQSQDIGLHQTRPVAFSSYREGGTTRQVSKSLKFDYRPIFVEID